MVLKPLVFALLMVASVSPSFGQESSAVIATVNDQPITTFDIDQRIKLLRLLGQTGGFDRRKIGNDLINDWVKIGDARRLRIDPTDKEIDERVGGMAKNLKTDEAGLKTKFGNLGISLSNFRQYIAAQMSFSRLLSVKFKEKIQVDQTEIDQKLKSVTAEINGKVAKIMADPRRQPINVYSILQIDFPVEANDPQLLQSRAIEATQYLQKFKGCGSARAAAAGIFNVKVGKPLEADAKKLPPQLKSALEAKGVGRAIGPVRGPKGIQAIAFCSKRTITPPKLNVQMPTRQNIENTALNEKFDKVEAKYVAIMRQTAVIEYKDQSYAQ